jgi:sensor histidine kinase YesM
MLTEASGGAYCRGFFRHVYKQITDSTRPHFFFCCRNIVSIIIPMQYCGRIVAYLKCGEIILSTADREKLLGETPMLLQRYALRAATLRQAALELPIEPKNRLYTVAEATMAIVRAILKQAESKRQQHELDKSRLSLVQEQLAKASLEKALHESGLKLLQSQINPHFLFNTLNTISQMAYLEGASKASALTRDLSELLRCTLRNSEQIIPLRDELALLRHYINIQKERFGERIRFTVDVDAKNMEDAPDISLPCMILQPLVENAIVHGLESRVEGGNIGIRLWGENNMLMLSVTDNGCGFNPEEYRRSAGNRVGLKSTRSRLAMHYGDNYYFSLHSAPGRGCTITLGVPPCCSLNKALSWPG